MAELPLRWALAADGPSAFYALLSVRTESIAAASFESAWERDRAYVQAIDEVLDEFVAGGGEGSGSKPRWLDGLVQRELRAASTTYWARDRFARVRLLERLGAVDLEPDDTYVLAMVSALGPDKPAKLRADPELVERAVWRLFEVEGGGEVSLTNVDRFGGEQWRKAFLELVRDGTLERSRVVGECLSALGRDFAAYRASWFSATYLALQPTPTEAAAFQPQLRRLLGSAVPATVAFAVKQLLQVHKAGLLEVAETLDALPAATLAKAKGTALDALRLARGSGSARVQAVLRVATTALGNPNPDVQRAAAELVRQLGGEPGLAAAGDLLALGVQQDLGLGVADAAATTGSPAQLLSPAPSPVAAGELAERTAALLEDASDAVEFEAVLAALAMTLGHDALTPLRKRARQVINRGDQSGPGDLRLSELVARLVLNRLGESVPTGLPATPALRFVARRVEELGQTSAPLLATPDLAGGWVSPAALVERLGRNPQPRHHDLVAALLRLHPDGRDAFGSAAVPPAVRYALDRTEPPRRLFRNGRPGPAAWWVAAERSWAPYGPGDMPQLSAKMLTHSWNEGGKQRSTRYIRFAVTTTHDNPATVDQPTELPAGRSTYQWGDPGNGDWVATIAAIWPQDAEHFVAIAGLSTIESGCSGEVAHDVPRVLDALARHPGRIGTLAVHALAAGLSSVRRDYRLHAIDAFGDLVPTGRIPAAELAATLATFAEAWPAVRWVESFTSAARAPGGGDAVVALLVSLLPQLPTDHRGLNRLLDLLRDETIRSGSALTDPAMQAWLRQFSGTSLAARSAARLLR